MGWNKKYLVKSAAIQPRSKPALPCLMAIAALAGVASSVQAADSALSKCDRILSAKVTNRITTGNSTVILQMDGDMNSKRKEVIAKLGGEVVHSFDFIDGATVKIPNKELRALCSLSWVKRVSHNFKVRKYDDFTVKHSFAENLWQGTPGGPGYEGDNINIAIVDSGIQPALDFSGPVFSSRLLLNVDFSRHTADVTGEEGLKDSCGHGTHVAGIAAGNGLSASGLNAFRQFRGSAPNANLIGVRVLERDGSGTVDTVLTGLSWVYENRSTWNVRIVNLSLGHPVGESYKTDPLCQAVNRLWKNGVVVVCAAGNMGRLYEDQADSADNEGWGTAYGSIQVPGNSPDVITVGAVKKDVSSSDRALDKIATYSSRGPSIFDYVLKPDVIAPGNMVVSVGPSNGYLFVNHGPNLLNRSSYLVNPNLSPINANGYYVLSGTSMAAPVVSGGIAQMLEHSPWLNPDSVKARLMLTATKWSYPSSGESVTGAGDDTDPFTFGAGLVDIRAAVNSTFVPTAPATSPSMMLDKSGNLVFDFSDTIWANRAVWGSGGPSPEAIYGLRAVWGNWGLNGSRAVWGTNVGIVNGTRAVWGNTMLVEETRAVWGSSSPACDLTSVAISGE